MRTLDLLCPDCAAPLEYGPNRIGTWRCRRCAFTVSGRPGYVDLLKRTEDPTSDHYSLQWGEEFGYLDFINANEAAKAVMPASQLGWAELLQEIREVAAERPVAV